MKFILRCVLAQILLLFVASVGSAQSVDGSIAGRVTDASGAAVPAAAITVVEAATGIERSTRTNRNGAYSLPDLPAGEYQLSAKADGFRGMLREGLTVGVGQGVLSDFELVVGAPSETIAVSAEVTGIETQSAALSTIISNDFIADLPLNGRNFLELALLAAGTSPAAAGSAGSERGRLAFQAAGMREDFNSFVYDGVYAIDPVLNSVTFTPPVDAVREFRVETSNSQAGLGRNAGAQVAVELKRGGNEWHGSIYEFVRNDVLDARNFFAPADQGQPKLRRNQFGGSIGGPIRQNTTFVFADYEGLRESRATTRLTNVPTLAERNGDFSNSSLPAPINLQTQTPFPNAQLPFLHPVGQGVASLYPLPNRDVAGQNYVASPTGSDAHNKFDVRLDHRLGENGLLAGRYSFSDRTSAEPYAAASFSSLPGYGNDIDERGQNAMLSHTQGVGVRWFNEARFGYNRVENRTFPQNSGTSVNSLVGLPDFATRQEDLGLTFIEVTGFSSLGDEFNNPQDSKIESFQISDTVNGTVGNHQLQFGFDQRWVRGNAFRHVLSRGQMGFTNFAFTQNALADLLLGLPSFTGGGMGDNDQNQRTWATNLFVQDSWRAHRNLTLTMGLRYEYGQPAYDAFDNAAIFDTAAQQFVQLGQNGVPRGGYEPDKNNFAPRIGLAWSPGGSRKTVVRSGYGIHYNSNSLASGQAIYFNPPFFSFQLFFPSQQSVIQIQDPWPAGGAAPVPPSATTYDRNLKTSYAQHWNFSLQRELAAGVIISATYNGTRGVNLLGARDINQPAPGLAQPNLRPLPFFADINQIESASDSTYHGLQLQLRSQMTAGLTGLFSYTWSRSIDNTSNFFSSAGDPNFPQDSRNQSAERARSNFDTPHRFVGSFTYDLPFGKGQRWGHDAGGAGGHLISGWKLNSIVTLQSGQPYSVMLPSELDNSNTGRSIFGFGNGDRPNVVGDPRPSNPDPSQWVDPAAFAFPAFGTFGDAGRNIIQGPTLYNVDLSAVKDTSLGESTTLQFRAEFFNALNTPNFFGLNIFFGNPGFGQLARARNGREIQFGIKLLF
ncbi:MAG: TonB-dependent receptor [Acidobacteria bacterium]|nr:TonB-dependent receptor [Acidobacteriota bacterium]MDA1233989.1 TonB-dependent receptor [Acidobacteriota bacterium]